MNAVSLVISSTPTESSGVSLTSQDGAKKHSFAVGVLTARNDSDRAAVNTGLGAATALRGKVDPSIGGPKP